MYISNICSTFVAEFRVHAYTLRNINRGMLTDTNTNKQVKRERGGFLRGLWYDYWPEFVFGFVLSVLTILSFWLGRYIPEDVFENIINPIEYVASIVVCFVGGWMILKHHKGNRLRIAWGIVLLIWGCMDAIFLYLRYGMNITAIGGTPDDPLFNVSVTAGNILAWLLFIYPTQVLRPGWLTWWRGIIQVLPLILLSIIDYFVPVNLLPIIMIYPAIIFIFICSHIRKYRQWCEDNFSSMDEIDAQWIVRYLTMLCLVGVSFYFICFEYVPNRMFTQEWLLLLILVYSTEEILFRKDPRASELSSPDSEQEETNESQDEHNAQRAQLEAWMENEKPYLNPNLQLIDLRRALPMNRTYLSQFLNSEYGCSFYQFVTGYRLEEAKRLMAAHPEMKLADVAMRSGFSSPVVFSRTFAREIGVTPSEWLSSGAQH